MVELQSPDGARAEVPGVRKQFGEGKPRASPGEQREPFGDPRAAPVRAGAGGRPQPVELALPGVDRALQRAQAKVAEQGGEGGEGGGEDRLIKQSSSLELSIISLEYISHAGVIIAGVINNICVLLLNTIIGWRTFDGVQQPIS